ncbi:hypothetical protein ACFQJ7_12665 [Halovenus rubra]|uniref:Uncharacterized protein n=2 Tax=Halovenus rubra TaxID=869890 RepID=A0ABD5XCE5_9EURY|nr:hypothetical protein [Halovenus rubra]
MEEWATEHNHSDATTTVDNSGSIEDAIVREADNAMMRDLGTTEREMLSRLVSDSLHLDVVDDIECSALLAERPSNRGHIEWLFGRGRRRKEATAGNGTPQLLVSENCSHSCRSASMGLTFAARQAG